MKEVEQLEILNPSKISYNCTDKMFIDTNKGKVYISYTDMFELVESFFDATIGINDVIESILERIDAEYCLDKY